MTSSASCNHKGWRLWLTNWISWCTNCGANEQHVGEVILGRKHKEGDVVDSVGSSATSNSGSSVSGVETVRPVTVYLAHPYARRDIGEKVGTLLEAAGITVINPFHRPEQTEIESQLPNLSDEWCDWIVRTDLQQIDKADTVVAIWVGTSMVGTAMEVYHNTIVNSRVTFSLVLDDYYKTHPWVRRLTRIHYNVESLVEELLRWPNV